MSLISFSNKGSFKNTERFLKKKYGVTFKQILQKYGEAGVEALRKYTPVDSGLTADSWSYEIVYGANGEPESLVWNNSNVKKGYFNVALMLQYGHATGTGGYVQGVDYINPALGPIFDKISESLWWEVKNS